MSSLQFSVRVIPNAKKTGMELLDGGLRVKLAAPAVEGKANRALLQWLAAELGIRKSALTLLRGEHSRTKTVLLGCGAEDLPETPLKRLLLEDAGHTTLLSGEGKARREQQRKDS